MAIGPKTAPDGRGFWASAGADGIFGGYYDKDGNGQYTPVVYAEGWNEDQVGDTVYMSGWHSGWVQGTEALHNTDYNSGNGITLKYQRITTGYIGQYGDSGASVLGWDSVHGGYKAVGTNVGVVCASGTGGVNQPPCQGIGQTFSQIFDVQGELSATVVTTPSPYYQAPVRAAAATAGSATDGSLFVDAVDGTVRRMDLANKSWETLPNGAVGNPSAVQAVGSSRLDVFIRGGDGYLYHNWNSTGAFYGWSSTWEQMPYAPVGISSDPTAINEGVYGVVEVFARASDGHLYQWRQSSFSGWGAHEYSNGATIVGNPAAQSWGIPGFHVFWRGSDNNLWETYNNASYPADTIAGGLGGDPMPLLNPGGNWDNVVWRGGNGTLHQTACCSPGWTSSDLGTAVASGSEISSAPNGSSIQFFFTSPSGGIGHEWCCSWGSDTLPSGNIGSSSPTAVGWNNNNYLDVYYRALGGDTVSDLYASNLVWVYLGAPAPAGPRW